LDAAAPGISSVAKFIAAAENSSLSCKVEKVEVTHSNQEPGLLTGSSSFCVA
jgi:hypothetical protein